MLLQRILVATLALTFWAARPRADEPRPPVCRVRVHLVNGAGFSPSQLQALRENVERVWKPHGISFDWRDGPPEDQLLPDGAVVLVLTTELSTERAPEDGTVVGTASFPQPVAPAQVLRVLTSATAMESTQFDGKPFSDWPRSTRDRLRAQAAGRVAAHELGHYLLATRQHTSTGLMRAEFSWSQLFSRSLSGFELDATDAALVRARWLSITACMPGTPGAIHGASDRGRP